VIRSCAKLAYTHAQTIIDAMSQGNDGECSRDSGERRKIVSSPPVTVHGKHSWAAVVDDVELLHGIASKLRRQRYEDGAVSLDNATFRFCLSEDDSMPSSLTVEARAEANFLIEELMLLANRRAAAFMVENEPNNAFMRRHTPPDPRKVGEFVESLATSNGIHIDFSSSKALCDSLREIEASHPFHLAETIRFMCTRPMKVAQYFCTGDFQDSADWRHYALAFPQYTHFTSPIRRYADICVHRIIDYILTERREEGRLAGGCDGGAIPSEAATKPKKKKVVRKEERRRKKVLDLNSSAPALPSQASLSLQAEYCNQQKLAARNAQDASNRLFMCLYIQNMKELIETKGVLVGVGKKTIDVFLPEFGFDRRIFLEDIIKKYTKCPGTSLRGTYEGAQSGAMLCGVRVAHDREAKEVHVMGTFDGCEEEVVLLKLKALAEVTCQLSIKTHAYLPMDIRANLII